MWELYYIATPYFEEGDIKPENIDVPEPEPTNAFLSSNGTGSFLDEEYIGGWV